MAYEAQQLLEHSLLGELRSVVARALNGLDMFPGNFSELITGQFMPPIASQVSAVIECLW